MGVASTNAVEVPGVASDSSPSSLESSSWRSVRNRERDPRVFSEYQRQLTRRLLSRDAP